MDQKPLYSPLDIWRAAGRKRSVSLRASFVLSCAESFLMSAVRGSTALNTKMLPGERLPLDLEDLYDILNLEDSDFCEKSLYEQKTEVVVPNGVEITEAILLPKLEEIPMLQLLNAPPKFSNPPSASCPPSIAGSPPTHAFGSFQLPSPPATTSHSLSTSCGSSPPKSTSPGYHPTPRHQSQPSSPRHRSPRSSISDAGGKQKVPRHKRPSHIKAEHRRRIKIQSGFDDIKELVPAVREMTQSSSKESKAGMLGKTADYCRQLHAECKQLQKESDKVKQEIAQLAVEISDCQNKLPTNGAAVIKPTQPENIGRMCDEYVHSRIMCNWKFWLFSIVMGTRPLFESYNSSVRTGNQEEFRRSVLAWMQEQCPLTNLRRVVSKGLRDLSIKSSAVNAPERLPVEAKQAALASILKPESIILKTEEHNNTMEIDGL